MRAGSVIIVLIWALVVAACAAQVPAEVAHATTSTLDTSWATEAPGRPTAGAPSQARTTTTPATPALPTAAGSSSTPPSPGTGSTTTSSTPATTSTTAGHVGSPTTTAGSAAPAAGEVTITTVLREEESTDPPYVVEMAIPQVSGLADPEVERRINDAIGEHASAIANPFIADLVAYLTDFPPDPGTATSSFELGYEVKLLTDAVLSIWFFEAYYTAGAANVNADVSGLVFDLRTGDVLTLDDLLVEDYARVPLSDLVVQALVAQYYDGDAVEFATWAAGARPEVIDDGILTPDGLEIGFAQYAVGPGALGTPLVTIPYGELSGILRPEILALVG